MTDIALLFPPQWSPFQPPLSVPSLSAWLRRDGFSVRALDANVAFYHWLYGDACIAECKRLLQTSVGSASEKMAWRAILDAAPDLAADIAGLQQAAVAEPVTSESAIRSHFLAINSMELFLDTVSRIAGTFTISPFAFSTAAGDCNPVAIEKLVDDPPPILQIFVDEYLAARVAPMRPRSVGLSCIGQEQLFFSLLFAKRAKLLLNVPIFIGGTIFSRIFERGALPVHWFRKYFDFVVRNEGEKPASALLDNLVNNRRIEQGVPGIVYVEGQRVMATAPASPLKPRELPIPDFDDLPLSDYITGHLSLPLLSSRGCYWGKCEFCHHGMVYGDAYGAYEADGVLATVQSHSRRYGVRHFAFNDEALPPKIARQMGAIFPDASTTSWAFTGLIKFEKFYNDSDFTNLRRIGFRSLYVGLESASERVLDLMRKPNKKATIVRNLTDASNAGVWMHCFLFFGFPGETEADAKETYDFIMENEDIIGSFGCGTFSLEHNAPIFRHLEDFVVQLKPSAESSVNVYYQYQVSGGISPERADELAAQLNEDARKKPKYFASAWIPREHLLSLLTAMAPAELVAAGKSLRLNGGIPATALTRHVFSLIDSGEQWGEIVAINRSNQRVLRVGGASAELIRLLHEENAPLAILQELGPGVYEHLVGPPIKLDSDSAAGEKAA